MGSLKSHHKLPVIDLTREKLEAGGREYWVKAISEVRSALEEYGCFVAQYDNVTLDLHDAVFRWVEEVFDLPIATKVQNQSSKPLYGYVGQHPFIPLYESMGIDDSNTTQGIQNFVNVMWPNGNDAFSETVVAYTKLVAELEQMVVRMVFESYGVEKYYESHRDAASYLFRMMKYGVPQMGETNMGFMSHTDKDFITVLHQNHVDGLEVKAKDGEWFSVELSPSSFVLMGGDAIMAWSNERIQSPHHRVTMNGKQARYSIAQFSFMKDTIKIETPKELVDENHPLMYKPFNHLDYLQFYDNNRYLESALKTYCGV